MNAKKLLSTLLSAAMAVSMLAGCFGGGGNKNYSDEAADAANAAQSTVVFSTDATLAKSLQDALADGLTQLDEIDDAMEADENLKPLLTSGWDLDIFAAQGEDAEAAAKTIAEQYIVSAVIGKKAEGKIAMVLHDGNGYYYVAVLTYGSGGSGSGGGAGGGSGSGDDGQGGNHPGDDDDKPGPDDDENNPDNIYTLTSLTVTGPTDTEYWVDETFSTDGMTITAVYTNKKGDTKTEPVDISDVTIDDKGPYEDIDVGTKEISISYTEDDVTVSDTVSITVKAHELVSISVTNPDKTTYEVGETFEPAGMTVTGTYKNGDNSKIEKPIDLNKCIFTPKLFEDDVAGQEVTITVTYTENGITKYDTVTVEVKANTHTITMVYDSDLGSGEESVTVDDNGIAEIVVTPKTGYQVSSAKVTSGDSDDATVTTDSNTVKVSNVQSDVTITVYFEAIEYTVTVETKGGDANCTVTPTEGTVSVEKPKFEFTVTVSDDYSAQPVVTSGSAYVVAGDDGKSYTVVTNGTGNVTVTVKFVKKQPVVTALYADPDTITRYVGQTFKKDDLKIYAVYDDDSANPVLVDIDDCKVTDAPNEGKLTAEGTYTVKVTFGNQTAEVTVIVKKPYVTGIKVTTTGTGNILREYRASPSPSDTVFTVYKYEKTGSFLGFPVFEWVEEYRDDITITIEYMGQDSLVIDTPKELKKYVEAGQLTAEEFTSPGFGLYNTQTVTVSYKDSTMIKAVDTEIDVTVTWIKPNT